MIYIFLDPVMFVFYQEKKHIVIKIRSHGRSDIKQWLNLVFCQIKP